MVRIGAICFTSNIHSSSHHKSVTSSAPSSTILWSFHFHCLLLSSKKKKKGGKKRSNQFVSFQHWLKSLAPEDFPRTLRFPPQKLYNIPACEDAEYFKSQDEQREGTQEKSTHSNHNLMELCTFFHLVPLFFLLGARKNKRAWFKKSAGFICSSVHTDVQFTPWNNRNQIVLWWIFSTDRCAESESERLKCDKASQKNQTDVWAGLLCSGCMRVCDPFLMEWTRF